MNKNDSNEQDIHDQLINLVTTLNPVIKALRALIAQADNAVAMRLDRSLGSIDGKVDEVSSAIEKLGSTASTTSKSLNQYQDLILKQLQAAVTAFTEDEMPRRYDDKISELIKSMKQQIDTALETIVAAKSDSLEVQVSSMQAVADKLGDSAASLALFTSQYQAGHEQIIKDIETLETGSQTRIARAEARASKDLDKIYKSIESMSIKRIAAAAAAGTVVMVLSMVALVLWYVPSLTDIADLRSQQTELQQGIDELETGWKQAFDNARNEQFIVACDVSKEKPDLISWCVRADSKSFLRDDKGIVYYKIAEVKRESSAE